MTRSHFIANFPFLSWLARDLKKMFGKCCTVVCRNNSLLLPAQQRQGPKHRYVVYVNVQLHEKKIYAWTVKLAHPLYGGLSRQGYTELS